MVYFQCKEYIALLIIIITLMIGIPQQILAHGDLDKRIIKATIAISAQPDSAYLYFKRGKLYFEHEEYSKTIIDLDQATTLGYKGLVCNLLYAKTYQKLEDFTNAMVYIQRIQSIDSLNVNALKTKAQILFTQQSFKEAALLYEQVITLSRQALLENYMDAFTAWKAVKNTNGKENALHILEVGITELGPIFTFYDSKKKLHLDFGDYKQALIVQEQIIALSERKEFALFNAAEICLLNGNNSKSSQYLNLARAAIEKLPTRIKQRKKTMALYNKIEQTQLKLEQRMDNKE